MCGGACENCECFAVSSSRKENWRYVVVQCPGYREDAETEVSASDVEAALSEALSEEMVEESKS